MEDQTLVRWGSATWTGGGDGKDEGEEGTNVWDSGQHNELASNETSQQIEQVILVV